MIILLALSVRLCFFYGGFSVAVKIERKKRRRKEKEIADGTVLWK